jgi:hypothetical protein
MLFDIFGGGAYSKTFAGPFENTLEAVSKPHLTSN